MKEGHQVRTTIRSARREAEVRSMVRDGGVESDQELSFSQTDLTDDRGWAAAITGCDYVLHVASPFPQQVPDNEDELIVPARDGTLRVLRAARDAGVKRVVLTSSFAAIGYGHASYDRVFDEDDWTDQMCSPISNPRSLPSEPPGTSSTGKAALWKFRTSTRWTF
ncbi:NAD-dependent epimerase/dehydratase family protein [Rhizobium sp. AB2/73]|uniref:NAD-dependent epimerase/dehydratase family protein n=1 Tax=Rhizobium sp. AB2/73 TaxID=2795216 RepID=UPI0027D9DC06|nr:NAD-dependent epimerase/dehydratase family protein [Rhizobium sp. AB2/73]